MVYVRHKVVGSEAAVVAAKRRENNEINAWSNQLCCNERNN